MRRYEDGRGGVEIIDLSDADIDYPAGRADIRSATRRTAGRAPARAPTNRASQRPLAPSIRVLPAGEVRPSRALRIARQPDSVAAQQFRLLRFRLKEAMDPQVIGVTSPMGGDGKTTTAANLALALAEGRRVRIVMLDLNLRAPALVEMFGLQHDAGAAAQLRQRLRQPHAPWQVLELGHRLHLLAGGHRVENPSRLLNSEELQLLVDNLAQSYDYVVVDLPAVSVGADVKLSQDHLDALVLVCRAGHTTRPAITNALKQLGGHKLQGVLLLDVEQRYMPK